MGDQVLEAFVKGYIESVTGDEVVFSWQGGEPTLLGIPFFEKAVALQRKYAKPGQRIANDLQTNGTLLDEDWARFLKANRFLVGLSIDGPREQLSPHAPRIESIKIDQEKIGAVIGKGGETIRGLCEEFEAEIDVEDDGTIRIYAPTGTQVEDAVARIQSMTKEAEVGDRYTGAKVVKTTTFGAFVELTKGTDGLLHISNVKPGGRVETVEEVLEQGQEIDVTVAEVDRERGRIGLRMTDDPAIAGKSPEEIAALAANSGGGGGRRGGDREGGRRRRDRGDRDRR